MGQKTFLALLVAMLTGIQAQVPGFGSCPKVSVMRDFSALEYLGLWFEVKKYPLYYTFGGKCLTVEYGLNPNGTIAVLNRQWRDGREEAILGSGKIITENIGELELSFPSVSSQRSSHFQVIDTDYVNYAVVFSCSSFLSLVHGKVVWVLTRTRFPSQSVLDRAYGVMRQNSLSTAYLSTTDNDGCADETPTNTIDSFRN